MTMRIGLGINYAGGFKEVAAEVAGRAGIVVFATAESDEPALRQAGVAAVFRAEAGEHVVTWAEETRLTCGDDHPR